MKKNKKALITGSSGLIGSESAKFFADQGYEIHGIDNDMRRYFFGKSASTVWKRKELTNSLKGKYQHYEIDIRNRAKIENLFKKTKFDLIIHTAAQPSHDWAAKEPFTDFDINAVGTLNLLENFRNYSSDAVFIFTSTNKVYGDKPNLLPLVEKKKRFEISPKHKFYKHGIDESMSIDNSKHSIFGASKVSADIMVQEYGKYFKLKTGVFRGGCLTGPSHSGAMLHGFLSYLIKTIISEDTYTIFGYRGKQVRDNIHSFDLITAFNEFIKNPKTGEAYNIGGSRHSNTSILEAIEKIESLVNIKAKVKYVNTNRIGDHIWYISDVRKFKKDFPKWKYTFNIDQIIESICKSVFDNK